MEDLKNLNPNELISLIRETLEDYKPKAVKRVFILKERVGKRPLGIPTIINKAHLHYVVDIDIKEFFENVNHKRLNST